MISFLEGEIAEKGASHVVLAVGGVGYDVSVPTSVLGRLPAVGKPARIHTRMVVRDDAMVLYGFTTTDERGLFDLLTGVSARDPLTFLTTSALLGGVALIASFIPAWRATRIDPLVALRTD